MEVPAEADLRRVRIQALACALRAHRYVPQVAETEPLFSVSGEGRVVVLWCDHRDDDAGRLWFWHNGRAPIAPADGAHLHEAITWVRGYLGAPRSGAGDGR